MSGVAWEYVLDELERGLDVLEEQLAAGALRVELDSGLPTGPLGPLPAELRFRATALQRRMGRVEESLSAVLHRSRRSLVLADRLRTAARVPQFVDTHG